ncbi:MAG: beta strand repeat-containing protein [Reyranella sp.]|uniref:beta strand repeat-containing protein n=2 Tax=Reyranella sp. TaxID=1929291 RepID=UPI003D0F6FFC
MTTFIVTNLNDSGTGSLRAAILASNADPSPTPDRIEFAVSGTINLSSDLPAITNTVQIDGTSAPSYVPGGPPVVEVNFNGHSGLTFSTGSSGSGLFGLALGNSGDNGVTLNASNITVDKNYIGIHANGSAFANAFDGVYVSSLSSDNRIGLNDSGASGVVGNVISANGRNGIALHGSADNVIVANRIGTSFDGNTAMANGHNGILLTEGANGNTIGGTLFVDTATGQVNNPTGDKGTAAQTFIVPPLGNLVSGNTADGILIENGSENNVLNGNFVGTNANGTAAVGNGGDGVRIVDADGNSLIGCTFVENPFVYYNILSGNGGNGLHVTSSDNVTIQANYFGIGAFNSVVSNGQNGILVDGDSRNTQVGGVIPLGNVAAGNEKNGIYVTDTVSGFITFNTFGGLFPFQGAAPNGNDGILIDSTGGNNLIRTNVFSGNLNNGIEIAGDAWGVTVDPNIAGLDTVGFSKTVNTGIGLPNMANGGHGLLITGTAHGNTIGGYLDSVIPQNTFSGNVEYGLAITGAAYDNQVFDNVIGANVALLQALGNTAGGLLLASSGSGNVIGGPTVDPTKPRSNFIGGNDGNGITIASGVTGDVVVGNSIGTDRAGAETLPNEGLAIAINGSYANYIFNNRGTPADVSIGLPPQEVVSQLEGLYIGFFGRAGDPAGVNYWMTQALTQMAEGSTLSQVMLDISKTFAASPENAPYSSLATQPLNPQDPQQVALATSFIEQLYQQAFNHAPDPAGLQYWLGQLFSGAVAFSALVYTIESGAQAPDQAILSYKLEAASYFTQLAAGTTPSLDAMEGAVQNVTSQTSFLISKASTETYTDNSENQVTYATAFDQFPLTGVRGDYDGKVVLTGSHIVNGANLSALYSGPLQDTSLGTMYVVAPEFSGQTITSANFYGPNTSIFTPSIGIGNVMAVGSYVYSESGVHDHGMIYQGPVSGGGTWTQIDVPSSAVGGAIVEDTIPHSVMGDLVVGNYDLQGVPESGNAFIYNMATNSWTIFDQGFGGTDQLTSAYAVWQNGIGSSSYTIAGGSKHGTGINEAFLVNYDSITGIFSDLKFYKINNTPAALSHFEGFSAVPGGLNAYCQSISQVAMAFIPVNADGSFGDAHWSDVGMPGAQLTTANSIYQNIGMGVYTLSDSDAVPSYTAVIDQSDVSELGGLIMPIGSLSFSYSTSVEGGIGALVVGSQAQGNLLGGSIGNDSFVGTEGVSMVDTIYTGGGADLILLSADRTEPTRIELYAGNSISNPSPVAPGQVQTAVVHSIVDANDVPQLGWWGQATAQFGGPVSDASTNLGHGTGTSEDMSVVTNFIAGSVSGPGDSVDLSLSAFSGLLASNNPLIGPGLGDAVFSNTVVPGGTVTVGNANVLILGGAFSDAAAVAAALVDSSTAINFSVAQINSVNHYMVAYQDLTGNVRIADMDIHNAAAYTNTSTVATLAVSDMIQLAGVSLLQLQESNIQFVV